MTLLEGIHQRENPRTKDEQLHVWIYSCPQPNCFYAISGETADQVDHYARMHECPYGGEFVMGASMTITLVETMWEKADALFTAMQAEGITEQKRTELRYELKGLCFSLALFGTPHYKSVREAAEEVSKRYRMREAGHDYESPGLGKRRYQWNDLAPTAKERAAKVLTDTELEGIKFAYKSGFTVEQLAEAYNLAVATVKGVVD